MKLLALDQHIDSRGGLVAIQSEIGFKIHRVFFIFNASGRRGEHAHRVTRQALIAVSGKCNVGVWNGVDFEPISLCSPDKCLLLEPEDYHYMQDFTDDCVLLVLASHSYNPADYIYKEEFFS